MPLIDVSCTLCGDSSGWVIGRFDGRYPIRRCRTCGLMYTAARADPERTQAHYEEEYIPSEAVLEAGFGARRRAALERTGRALRARHPAGGTILDVGAAGGQLLDQFPDGPWRKVALEPSKIGARQLESKGLDVVTDVYPSDQLAGRSFDVVAMMDVIMLIPDPVGALSAARGQLRPGGTLAVEIPGYAYRTALHVGPVPLIRKRRWTDLNAAIHLYFFSDHTLRLALARAGLAVVSVVVLPPSVRGGVLGLLQDWVGRAIERLPGVRSGSPSLAAKYVYLAEAIP